MYKSFPSLVKLIPRHFILLDAIINGIFEHSLKCFLNFLFRLLTARCRNTGDLYIEVVTYNFAEFITPSNFLGESWDFLYRK